MDVGRWSVQAECTSRLTYNGIVFSFKIIKCSEKGAKRSIMRSCALLLHDHTEPASAGSLITVGRLLQSHKS